MKKLLWFVGFLSIVLLAGCSSNNESKSSNAENSEKTVSSVFYQNLSNKDKKQMKFTFKADKDETNVGPGTSEYVLSMKVTNNTKKNVKFDQSKFILISSGQHNQNSSTTGTLTIKPGQTKNINQLFENVGGQGLIGPDNEIIYLNKDNKVGTIQIDKATSSEVNSANSGESSEESNSNQTTDDTTNTSAANSGRIITSPDMAMSLYAHSMGLDPNVVRDGGSVEEVDGGYRVSYSFNDVTIKYNGDEIDDSGNLQPFASLIGPTHSSSGFTYNGHNYNQ
jgi:outer membrane murein-binding lipoprotein Lpp